MKKVINSTIKLILFVNIATVGVVWQGSMCRCDPVFGVTGCSTLLVIEQPSSNTPKRPCQKPGAICDASNKTSIPANQILRISLL